MWFDFYKEWLLIQALENHRDYDPYGPKPTIEYTKIKVHSVHHNNKRNYANSLWNSSRFSLSKVSDNDLEQLSEEQIKALYDAWNNVSSTWHNERYDIIWIENIKGLTPGQIIMYIWYDSSDIPLKIIEQIWWSNFVTLSKKQISAIISVAINRGLDSFIDQVWPDVFVNLTPDQIRKLENN